MQLAFADLNRMLEQGEVSSSVAHRRKTLIAIAELALTSRSNTPASRARTRHFLAQLRAEENNDEIEVTGEAFCEVVMLAMKSKD